MTSWAATVRVLVPVLIRSQLRRGRIAAVTAVGGALVVGSAALALGGGTRQALAQLMIDGGFLLAVPVTALVFAIATLGELRDDATLVYVWLRPVPRTALAAAGALAAAAAAVPVSVAVIVSMALAGQRPELVLPGAAAAALGSLAYVGLFVALGLRTSRSLVWGLGYVLLFEGFLARFSDAIATVTVRRYATSVLTRTARISDDLAEVTLPAAVTTLLAIAVVGVLLAAWWLHRRDVP